MDRVRLLGLRQAAQRLTGETFAAPEEVVGWFGAVQAQDYPAAKWAVGLRLARSTDAEVQAAFQAGRILRTHVLRPTWHLVRPADLRWMLQLTAPRVHQASAFGYRQLGLDPDRLRRTDQAIAAALAGGRYLTRVELLANLAEAGYQPDPGPAANIWGIHVAMHAELEGVMTSGPMRGRQHTYALLEERVPPTEPIPRAVALAELSRRYFMAHGPATLKDFSWWSGLTMSDAQAGVAAAGPSLTTAGGYWMAAGLPDAAPDPHVTLLPNYDEYTVAFTDRTAFTSEVSAAQLDARGNILFNNVIISRGIIIGTWRKTLGAKRAVVAAKLFRPLLPAQMHSLSAAAARYAAFLGLESELTLVQ